MLFKNLLVKRIFKKYVYISKGKNFLIIFKTIMMISHNSNSEKSFKKLTNQHSKMTEIDFWNGNRSEIRQLYERDILEAVLKSTIDLFGNYKIIESFADYPELQESFVFSEKKHHLFVTVAGNQKFKAHEIIMISKPIAKNLLGYRIPIIKKSNATIFGKIKETQQLQNQLHGIPVSWSDATIFRHNDFKVAEEGDFETIFERLDAGKFDYVTFGANEVISVFESRAAKFKSLQIDSNLLFFYPFPLVFYVNPTMPDLAKRIDVGMQNIIDSGELNTIFNRYYANIVQILNLDKRTLIILENPLIPEEFANLKPDLAGLDIN